ncbi:MAG TPA: formate--tetrahydrofolate ligase, partial [Woeseiaceae bacterium]|nr:formate--tetrahydrofolate ligase [Woeseiaceae bacterium]
MSPQTDIEIAQTAKLLPIQEIGKKLGLSSDLLIPYGRDKAKIDYPVLENQENRADGKLILVTAVSPTPAGEGKT